MRAVSLFSNCGAGDVGYRRAGFDFEVMAELDPRRLTVCSLNHPGAQVVPGDLRTTWEQVLADYHSSLDGRGVPQDERSPDLLAACPPCQGMSSARSGLGSGKDPKKGFQDERNLLVMVIAAVARALRPRTLVVENVPQFLTRKVLHPRTGEAVAASRLLIDELSDYAVFPILTDLADFGVPQTRRRSFLTFVRRDVSHVLNFLEQHGRSPYPIPSHAADHVGEAPVSISRALEDSGLPSLDAASRETAVSAEHGGLHAVPVWPERRYAMVRAIPPGSGRSAWENEACARCGEVDADADALRCPKCDELLLRPIVEEADGTARFVKGFRSSSYRRMSPSDPAATITTASGHVGSDLTIHPTETRLLSTLECAVLQSFPDDFEWGDALKQWGHTNVRDMIGEAVPPAFTKKHGTVLRNLLDGECSPEDLLPLSDVRCTRPRKKLGLDPHPSLFAEAK